VLARSASLEGRHDRHPSRPASPAPQDDDLPIAIAGRRGNLELLLAVDDAAQARGLHVGLALAEARAMHPDLTVVPEDAAADARLLDALADACLRYTPLVAVDPPDGLLLDIGGCAHLFGGEAALVDDLQARLTRHGFASRIGVGDTIGAAWAAAHFAPAICPRDGQRALLAPLPLAALRLDADTVAALARVGLKRIGDILDLPRAPLAARFGASLLRQLDRALGREHEPLGPRLPVAPYVAEQPFAEPIAREEDVLAVVERLAGRLQRALERHGDGARQVELTLFRTDGAVRRIGAGTSRPLRDPREIRALFVERLAALADEIDPGFGFDLARLAALVVEPAPPEQAGFDSTESAAELDRLVDRLSARLGARRVTRVVAHDSHLPELAAGALPAQAVCGDNGWEAFRRYRIHADLPARPLRLLPRPEPIEAIATVPDGPPVRFRWRRALHEVVAAEGPERIEDAWWMADGCAGASCAASTRDYFRVEDGNGLRFWLFRRGLYRGPAEPRWFMHGLFA
jgi:protein ImuB